MRSRDFNDEAFGMRVPLLCLMNHPAVGVPSNFDAVTESASRLTITTQ